MLLAMANPPPDHYEFLAATAAAEDYIDMDISSNTSTFLYCCTAASPPHSADFEFQMCANPPEAEAAAAASTAFSFADELIYKGRLLPSSPGTNHIVHNVMEKFNASPAGASTASGSTPFLSCKLKEEDYSLECSAELVKSSRKKNWSTKLKSMKKSSLGLKLKATRDYLKSLFSKSRSSVEPTVALKTKECSNGYVNHGKVSPVRQAWTKRCLFEYCNSNASHPKGAQRERLREEDLLHRKSFSGAINWNLVERSSMTYRRQPQQTLRRSSSGSSEVECSVQGAIAYCKKSQQMSCGRKSVSDVGFCALSPRQIAAAWENEEKPGLCRG